MKNRGKNKKKQWRRILKNISSDLHDAVTEENLESAGFEVQKTRKIEILKGDKEAAKDHPDIPTGGSFVESKSYKPAKPSIYAKCIDIWDENFVAKKSASITVEKARKSDQSTDKPSGSTLIVPAGQSYNPAGIDHRTLLMHVAKEEEKAIFAADPGAHKKRRKLQSRKKSKLTQAQLDTLRREAKMKGRKPTVKDLAKRMHNDLENIPKLLKEIKKEKRELEAKNKRRHLRKVIKKYDKSIKFPLSFQLPGELAQNLRKLRTEQNWIREVEFKRNKLPRARKTLDKKAAAKIYERRSRKNVE